MNFRLILNLEKAKSLGLLLKEWGPIVGTVIAVAAFYRTCQQEYRIESKDYLQQAIATRPIWEVQSRSFYLQFKPRITDTAQIVIENGKRIKTIDFIMQYDTVHVQFVLFNRGSAMGKLKGLWSVDTILGSPHLRDVVLGRFRPSNITISRLNRFFSEFNILPGNTDTLKFETVITRNPGQEGTMHFLLIYENEIGSLFDTYYWVKYEAGKLDYPPETFTKVDSGLIVNFKWSNRSLSEQLIGTQLTNIDFKIYTYEEKKRFEETDKEWQAKFNTDRDTSYSETK